MSNSDRDNPLSNSEGNNTARYTLTAIPDPSVMSRVLELFAKRNLVPDYFSGALVQSQDPVLEMTVELAGLDEQLTGYLGRCMEQITYVLAVQVCDRRQCGAAE